MTHTIAQPAHPGISDGLRDGEGRGEITRRDGIHVKAAQGVNDVKGKAHRRELGKDSGTEEPIEVSITF